MAALAAGRQAHVPVALAAFTYNSDLKLLLLAPVSPRVVRKATSCNLCHEHDEPSCVYACPHDAAHRVTPTTFFSQLMSSRTPSETRPATQAGETKA